MVAIHPQKRRGATPSLDLDFAFELPYHQEARLPVEEASRAQATARAVLRDAGFDTLRETDWVGMPVDSPAWDVSFWLGERGVHRRSVTSSTAVLPIITVFVAGSILGGIDAYIAGSVVVGVFWVLGAAGAAGFFWLRFGGTYDSDLAMVTLSKPRATPASGPGSISVVFSVGRLRSQVRSDERLPSVVSGPFRLLEEAGSLSREFERRTATAS